MDFVLHNLRLQELVAIVRENEAFYDDFVSFLETKGYATILEFVQEPSDEIAQSVIAQYLNRKSDVKLYDGLLRPYANAKAKWYFLAWLLRDAATQRLQPLLKSVPGSTSVEKKTYLLNEIRKFVEPLFPEPASWEWAAVSEVMLTRLEGSRRALKGTLFEELVRRSLRQIIKENSLPLEVNKREVKINDETYDVQVTGSSGSALFPVKTRETMGGGHALLFTRDIYKSIYIAAEKGYTCIPIVIAESWAGDLESLRSELYIYIQANPNQVTKIEPILLEKLREITPVMRRLT